MSIDIKVFGHTFHIGSTGKSSASAETSKANSRTKTGRSVSISSDTQQQIPKGKKGYTPKALVGRAKVAYFEHTSAKKSGVGHKVAIKELGAALKNDKSPENLQAILKKHTSSVSSLNSLLSQLPKDLQHSSKVIFAVRLQAAELLRSEETKPAALTSSSVSADLKKLRSDHLEVTGGAGVDLEVSVNKRLKEYPDIDLLMRGPDSGNLNEKMLKGAETRILQSMLSFQKAQHLRQQLQESPSLDRKLVEDSVTELTNMMHDLAIEVRDTEMKQIPLYRGVGAHYLSPDQYSKIMNQAPKERVAVQKNKARRNSAQKAVLGRNNFRPAPAAPPQSAVREQVAALSKNNPNLAADLGKIETHFLNLQGKGVKEEHLQQIIEQYPNYEQSWGVAHFVHLSDHVADALLTGAAKDVDDAFVVGDRNYRATF